MTENTNLITTTDALAQAVKRFRNAPCVTIDTEFNRTSTFFATLCLVQIADRDGALAIDPLAENIDLDPLYHLLRNKNVLKIFHAARQDMEIFYHMMGDIVQPVFDTQVAAMVCGFGDSVGYDNIVRQITGAQIDKSTRFTDWTRRPLSRKQLDYALSDVTHLRDVHDHLVKRLEKNNRAHWLEEEMSILTTPDTYAFDPEEAWLRLKTRSNNRYFLTRVKALAAWRERLAMKRNEARPRVMRDETLTELAAHPPKDAQELARVRGVSKSMAEGRWGKEILGVLNAVKNMPDEDLQKPMKNNNKKQTPGPVLELLKVLLKHVSSREGVAAKMIASVKELEAFVSGDRGSLPFMSGWRYEIFGQLAEELVAGKILLRAKGKSIDLIKPDQE